MRFLAAGALLAASFAIGFGLPGRTSVIMPERQATEMLDVSAFNAIERHEALALAQSSARN